MPTRIIKILTCLLLVIAIIPAHSTFAGEKVLRLLVWEGYAPEAYVQEFKKEIESKYGVHLKMEISYALADDDFFNLARDKKIDVITVGHYSIKGKQFKYIQKGIILPFDLKNVPNHVSLVPALKDAAFDKLNGKIYGIPVANGPYGLFYSTKAIKKAPQSWGIFWNPEYKNKYAIGANEYIYNIQITAMAMGYPRNEITSFDALNNINFRSKLRQLAVNAGAFWVGVDKPKDLLGMSLAMAWGDALSSLEKIGEKWERANPVEGTIWWIDEYAITWSLADKPVLKKIAEEWINKSLSSDFQMNHILGELRANPVVTHTKKKLPDKENKTIEINPTNNFSYDQRILQHAYSQRDKNGFKLMWDKAMEGVAIKRIEK